MLLYLSLFIASFFFFFIYEKIKFKSNILFTIFSIILILIAGTRFETGQDWDGYMYYFQNINTNRSILEEYRFDNVNQKFEFGFFWLNYILKVFDFSYLSVFFVSTLFSSLGIYFFLKTSSGNKFYILCIYISYTYLLLQFAQIRQAIAIGFFLFGLNYYIVTKKKLQSLIITFIGCFFQVSSLIYFLVFIISISIPNYKKINKWFIIIFSLIISLIYYIGSFTVLSFFLQNSFQDKLDTYSGEQNLQGMGLVAYNFYLFIFALFLIIKNKLFTQYKDIIINRIGILSLFLTISLSILFPGNYTMYSRLYLLSSILAAYSLSEIMSKENNLQNRIFYYLSILISFGYYYKIVSSNIQEYTPYKSWLFSLL